jgi:hypothetical protein
MAAGKPTKKTLLVPAQSLNLWMRPSRLRHPHESGNQRQLGDVAWVVTSFLPCTVSSRDWWATLCEQVDVVLGALWGRLVEYKPNINEMSTMYLILLLMMSVEVFYTLYSKARKNTQESSKDRIRKRLWSKHKAIKCQKSAQKSSNNHIKNRLKIESFDRH